MKSIILGLKRHPLRLMTSIFLAYSVLWTLIESLAFFNPTIELQGFKSYLTLGIISVVIGLWRVYQPRHISIKINTSDTILNIYYGDIFKSKGYIGIAVNEFFDSELGDLVSEKSLHGMVIKNHFGNLPESFDKAISKDLLNCRYEEIKRKRGNTKKYPIGTTAKITTNDNKFLLFALCYTDIETFKASSDLATMVTALNGLFSKARNCTNGESLIIPLVGSGLSGIGLPATQLLQLIVLIVIDETKRKQICKQIDLVVHESRFEEIDIETIKSQWG